MSIDLLFWTSAQGIQEKLLADLNKIATEFNVEPDSLPVKINSVGIRQVRDFSLVDFINEFNSFSNPTVNVFAATSADDFIISSRINKLANLVTSLIQLHSGTRHCLLLLRAEPRFYRNSEQKVLFNLGRDLYDSWIQKAASACRETGNSRYFNIGWMDSVPIVTTLNSVLDHDKKRKQLVVVEYINFLTRTISEAAFLAKYNTFSGVTNKQPRFDLIPFFDDFSSKTYFSNDNSSKTFQNKDQNTFSSKDKNIKIYKNRKTKGNISKKRVM